MKKIKYPELKSELKILAKEIKECKRNRKQDRRIELKIELWEAEVEVYFRKSKFRTKHIAYCMLNGKKYEEIERKHAPNNFPDWDGINKIRESYEQKTLCYSS